MKEVRDSLSIPSVTISHVYGDASSPETQLIFDNFIILQNRASLHLLIFFEHLNSFVSDAALPKLGTDEGK